MASANSRSSKKPKEKKKPTTKPAPKPKSALSRFEAWTPVEVERSHLKGADYNPRQISDEAKGKLRNALSNMGLVQPIVWNKRTGNIVGGHQRLSQLDALEGSPNYRLTVAQVDVDEKTEKELNVLLNNPEVSGDWDLEKLKDLLTDETLDIANTGFDPADVFKLFGDEAERAPSQAFEQLGEKVRDLKNIYKQLEAERVDKDDPEFYLVVVFKGGADRERFLEAMGLEDNRYVSGTYLLDMLETEEEGAEQEG